MCWDRLGMISFISPSVWKLIYGIVKFYQGEIPLADEQLVPIPMELCLQKDRVKHLVGTLLQNGNNLISQLWDNLSSHHNSVPEHDFLLQTEHVNHSYLLFLVEKLLNALPFADSQNGPNAKPTDIMSRKVFYKSTQRMSTKIVC